MEAARPRSVLIWLIIATLLAAPAAAAGGYMALFTPMMFDAPGSENNVALRIVALSVVTFPFVTLAAMFFAWIAFALRRPRGAVVFSLLPLVPLITGLVALGII